MDNNLSGKYNISFVKIVFFIIAFFLAFSFFVKASSCAETEKNVLILHSYHNGFLWTDSIQDGIKSVLNTYNKDLIYYTEYLDWKRFPMIENLEKCYQSFQCKYKDKKIDLIITSDDAALEFALKFRKELFSDAPIVFCGIFSETAESFMKNNNNLTGVIENVDVDNTIKYAKIMNHDIKKVYVICERSEIGITVENMIDDRIKAVYPNFEVSSLSNISLDDIKANVKELSSDSIILIGAYNRDVSGQHLSSTLLAKKISQASSVPVYAIYDYIMGAGVIGGSLQSGDLQGENAAKLGLEILNGKKTTDLPLVSDESFKVEFDYNVMKRFNISEKLIPRDAILINKKVSLFEQYKMYIILDILIFCFMICLITLLFINITRRRKTETALINKNIEITKLYDTVTSSEEELRTQYEEISTIKESLTKSEERYRLASEGSNDALWDWDIITGQIHFSKRWYELLDYEMTSDLSDDVWKDKIHPDDYNYVTGEINKHLLKKSDCFMVEHRLRTSSGKYIWVLVRGKAVWDINNKAIRFAGSMTDITQRKENEFIVERLAYFDVVTGLPNRIQAIEIIDLVIGNNKSDERNGLLFIDIDNFKYINDTFGHAFGDKILVKASERLKTLVDDNVKVARIGGDEFIVFVINTDYEEINSYAQNILTMFKKSIEIDGKINHLSVSIGVSVYPDHAKNYKELMQFADAAMYKAKAEGKSRCEFFDAAVHKELIDRVQLEAELRNALNKNELFLHYQPQVELKTGKIVGVEALLRWENSTLGLIPPDKFIHIAEETGQIVEIGNFVFKEAVNFLKKIINMGFEKFTISINVSIIQMKEERFVRDIIEIVRTNNIDPYQICIEITESVLIESFDEIKDKILKLKSEGLRVALDDFGKGYSSLNYLKVLPITCLKIDKEFIDDLLVEKQGKSLTVYIIDIAHQFGLQVIAEGIECEEQFYYLQNNNCDYYQGYYFSKPIPEYEVIKMLQKSKDESV